MNRTSDEHVLEDAKVSMDTLSTLADELLEHAKNLKSEIERLRIQEELRSKGKHE